jgi:hypothetical protein
MTSREVAILWIHQPKDVCHEIWTGTGVKLELHWSEDLKGLALSNVGSTKHEAN